MEPVAGFEPATSRLQGGRSSQIELYRQLRYTPNKDKRRLHYILRKGVVHLVSFYVPPLTSVFDCVRLSQYVRAGAHLPSTERRSEGGEPLQHYCSIDCQIMQVFLG